MQTIIENAMAIVLQRHGILRVGISGEDTKAPSFTFVESIDMRDVVKWKSVAGEGQEYDDALLRSLEHIHDSLWDDLANKPGLEVIVHHPVNTSTSETTTLDITFAFHHAYADGVASKLFHRDLLEALNRSSPTPEALRDHVLQITSPPELLPGMETIIPLKISWSYLLRTIWNEIVWQNMVPEWFKSKPPADSIPWTGNNISLEPHHVNIRLIEVPRRVLSVVVRACRKHKTTLTPLLHVLIAASLARRLPTETAPAFSTTTPIDLRRYAKPEYDVTNNIAGLVTSHDDIFDSRTLSGFRRAANDRVSETDEFIWQIASSLSTGLRHKVSTLPNDDIVGMLSWVSDWKKFWTDKFGTKRGSTWEVSNIGSFKAAEASDGREGGWIITRSLMTQGALPAGSAFSVNMAGVEDRGLCLSLTWQETIVERELMDGLAADLKASLMRLGESGSFGLSGE